MKYLTLFIIVFFNLNNVSGIQSANVKKKKSEVSIELPDSLIIAKLDSAMFIFKLDSMEREFQIMLYLFQLQENQVREKYEKSRSIIIILGVIVIILLFLSVKSASKKFVLTKFPYYRQKKGNQPGIICLQMMHKYYYGKKLSYKKLKKASPLEDKMDVMTLKDLAVTAGNLGFDVKVCKTDINNFSQELQIPVMVYLPNHMAVLYYYKDEFFYLADPYYGFLKLKLFYFATAWLTENNNKGIAFQLYPLRKVKKSVRRKLDLEKFSKLTPLNEKYWENYSCEMNLSKPE
ncbi:MAG: hypothetical protein JXJ22_02245 [Bacteroidales bacterium]|nr:hypothetical protein [Bacteroidales bacterium]